MTKKEAFASFFVWANIRLVFQKCFDSDLFQLKRRHLGARKSERNAVSGLNKRKAVRELYRNGIHFLAGGKADEVNGISVKHGRADSLDGTLNAYFLLIHDIPVFHTKL